MTTIICNYNEGDGQLTELSPAEVFWSPEQQDWLLP